MSPPDYRELVGSYLDLRWQLDPVAATQAGVHAHDGRLGEYARPQVKIALAALKSMAGAFEYCETESLADAVDQTAVLNDLRSTIARFEKEKPHERSAEFYLSHLFSGLFALLLRADQPAESRARALAARLKATPRFLRDARATLKRPARVFTETALAVAGGGRALFGEVMDEFAAGLAPATREALQEARAEARTALDEFVEFVGGELLDRSDAEFAIGATQFDFRLHYEHALRESAPELQRFGEALVRAQETELTRRAEALAPGMPWRELVKRLRQEHPPRTALVAEYAGAMERARRFVGERDLMTMPAGKLEVVATPSFMQPLIPFAAYDPPSAFAPGRTGWFYVSVPEEAQLREHSVYELATTALHEGYPGHHVQFLAAQAQSSPVRKVIGTPLTLEGWALYCEQMMGEEGFYTHPEEAFFQQMHMLWRAVRVVLDVRLQTGGMTVEQAVRYMMEVLDLARPSAEAEVRRYCCNPGQALCYAVGCHELLRLREDWRRRAGSGFSLKKFHDEVLSYGGLPVSLMRWGMGLGDSER
ncbi:MAG TPA: DUF885 domain-containing protein [Gemmatimonadales bacterium]|nr:DUF885 domain-containing protein [Gemmatimonadales bacterium]